MFSIDALRRYHELAHEGLDKLYAHVASLPPELLQQELPGFGLPNLAAQLSHIYAVELFWVLAVEKPWPPEEAPDTKATLEKIDSLRSQAKAATRSLLERWDEAQWNTPRELAWEQYKYSGVPAEMLLHLMTHAYHHKGQAVAMCRQLGHPAPSTDMFWIGFQAFG